MGKGMLKPDTWLGGQVHSNYEIGSSILNDQGPGFDPEYALLMEINLFKKKVKETKVHKNQISIKSIKIIAIKQQK